jgi:hypothetical protein
MKLLASTPLLLVLAGAPSFAFQEPANEQQNKPKPTQQDESKKQKPEKEKQQPESRERNKQQPEKENQSRKDQERQAAEKQRGAPNQQAQRQEQDRTHQGQRDGGSRRIPDDRFRAHFGREHAFHVERRDDRRFRYSGYWFEYTEPWPSDWGYDDDVYVDEIDGEYYLIDSVHPTIQVLVVVVG